MSVHVHHRRIFIDWFQVSGLAHSSGIMSRRDQSRRGQGGGSTSKSPVRPTSEEQDVTFRLSFQEALDDPVIANKLARIVKSTNQDLIDSVNSLVAEVRSLKASLAQRDATIAELRGEIKKLREDHDALEQYGRRNNLRISGIPEKENEDTTEAVMKIASEVMELDPPLQPGDIEVSHRLPKPRNSKPGQPRQIIVRFRSKATRYRLISNRKNLREYNNENDCKIYINDDLTSTRARLFSTVRSLQKKRLFDQVWTYNGNVKVKDNTGHVVSIGNLEDVKQCLPDVDLTQLM